MNIPWAIEVMQKCFVPPQTLDRSKVDSLTFSVAATYISQAVETKLMTAEEIETKIKEGKIQ